MTLYSTYVRAALHIIKLLRNVKNSKTDRLNIKFRRIILCKTTTSAAVTTTSAITTATTIIHEDINNNRQHRDKYMKKKIIFYDRCFYSNYVVIYLHVIWTILFHHVMKLYYLFFKSTITHQAGLSGRAV